MNKAWTESNWRYRNVSLRVVTKIISRWDKDINYDSQRGPGSGLGPDILIICPEPAARRVRRRRPRSSSQFSPPRFCVFKINVKWTSPRLGPVPVRYLVSGEVQINRRGFRLERSSYHNCSHFQDFKFHSFSLSWTAIFPDAGGCKTEVNVLVFTASPAQL